MRSIRLTLALLLLATCADASVLSALRGHSDNTISLKKRLHVNTLITEPGTVEIDWASLYSFGSANFAMPSAIKYTPVGSHILWGRTEYSIAFDSLDVVDFGGGRLTQFSQTATLTATAVVHDGEKFDIAIAPQVTFFLRDESGARLGAIAIARYDFGQNTVGTSLSWSGATHPSPTNPAGTFDAGIAFGRRLAPGGALGHLTPHINVVWERSTGFAHVLSVFEGVEYQITERVAVDFSAQHFAAAGGTTDHQAVIGMTVNLGHAH